MSTITSINQLDKHIEKATSASIPNGEIDLSLAMEICDVIRSRKISPKESMRCLKKRLISTKSNPNTHLSSWRLVDVCIKNGGMPFLKEICSREFMDFLEHAVLQHKDKPILHNLLVKMVYELYIAFKHDSQMSYVSTIYSRLSAKNISFPTSNDSNSTMIIFQSKTPADWVDSDACMICSNIFTLLNRKHHCRSCGGIFCQDHSSHNIPLPDLGILDHVRVCDTCYDDYDLKSHSIRHTTKTESLLDQEDENLKKAIKNSLKESQNRDVEILNTTHIASNSKLEENDSDLNAAIEASLREHELEQKRRNFEAQNHIENINSKSELSQFDLTYKEEEDIHLFSSLVQEMKTQPATAVLDNNKLQDLYQKITCIKPRLSQVLNNTINRYNCFVDMNGKISDITNIYDALLERQLRDINISKQYSTSNVPSDPYSYYQPLNSHLQNYEPGHKLTKSNNEVSHLNPTSDENKKIFKTVEDNIKSVPGFSDRSFSNSANNSYIEHTIPMNTKTKQGYSELPYPAHEYMDNAIPTESRNYTESGRKEVPYPEDTGPQTSEHFAKSQFSSLNITQSDFPSVPTRITPISPDIESNIDGESTSQEQLLIEL